MICLRRRLQITCGLQTLQQQVKINETSIRLPWGKRTLDFVVARRLGQTQPALQVVSRADIVAWKHVRPSQAAEKYILGSPAANAA
jgi:hypothetical protein